MVFTNGYVNGNRRSDTASFRKEWAKGKERMNVERWKGKGKQVGR